MNAIGVKIEFKMFALCGEYNYKSMCLYIRRCTCDRNFVLPITHHSNRSRMIYDTIPIEQKTKIQQETKRWQS